MNRGSGPFLSVLIHLKGKRKPECKVPKRAVTSLVREISRKKVSSGAADNESDNNKARSATDSSVERTPSGARRAVLHGSIHAFASSPDADGVSAHSQHHRVQCLLVFAASFFPTLS